MPSIKIMSSIGAWICHSGILQFTSNRNQRLGYITNDTILSEREGK